MKPAAGIAIAASTGRWALCSRTGGAYVIEPGHDGEMLGEEWFVGFEFSAQGRKRSTRSVGEAQMYSGGRFGQGPHAPRPLSRSMRRGDAKTAGAPGGGESDIFRCVDWLGLLRVVSCVSLVPCAVRERVRPRYREG